MAPRKYNKATTEQKKYDAEVINKQRYPAPDISALSLTFFQSAITAFMEDLRRNFRMFINDLPMYIFNTGDELMTNDWKPTERDITYQEIPRFECDIESISISSDQLSSPFERGEFIIHEDDEDRGFSANLRRIPITYPIVCTITVSNIMEQLKWQEVFLLLLYKNNIYHFQHYKKDNRAVYRLPDDMQNERNIELGFDATRKNRTIKFTVNIDMQYPAFDYFNSSSLFATSNVIKNPTQTFYPDPTVGENNGKENTPGNNGLTTDYGNNNSSSTPDKPTVNTNYGVDIKDTPNKGSLVPKTGTVFPDANGEIHYDEKLAMDELGNTALPRDAYLKVKETLNSQEPLPPRTLYKDSDLLR